jgi:alpha-ketoglutarate-dependent taurine dioxygenase
MVCSISLLPRLLHPTGPHTTIKQRVLMRDKMTCRGFLGRTLPRACDCFPGSRPAYRRPSHRSFLGTLHNNSTNRPLAAETSKDAESSQEMENPYLVRNVRSKDRHLMERLDDLKPLPTTESLKNELNAIKSALVRTKRRIGPQQTPMPKSLTPGLNGKERQKTMISGVQRGMTAKAVSKKLFTRDGHVNVNPLYLRDACNCPQCVDPSTRQRNYSFIDIPLLIKPVLKKIDENHTYHVSWEHDVAGFDESHTSYLPASRIEELIETSDAARGNPRISTLSKRELWDKAAFTKRGCWVEYEDYINNTSSLKSAVSALRRDGLIFIKNVPPEDSSVSKVAERIGPLRNTFYGATWDVRSIADAKNVAYTSKYLGFHMDLLYMDSPPEFQLLHCIHNSCAGGESRFVDTYRAARILHEKAPEMALELRRTLVKYTYDNDGHYYTNSHRIFNTGTGRPVWLPTDVNIPGSRRDLGDINWSPEFMDVPGIERMAEKRTRKFLTAAKTFAEIMEREDLVYQVKMEEGTCVIFENRRVAHARNAFEMQSGERWLRGGYLDYDAFWSKYKVLGLADKHKTTSVEDVEARNETDAD